LIGGLYLCDADDLLFDFNGDVNVNVPKTLMTK
jgi:hypothetical protein